ncbi:heparanase [Amia ocellicauda]|uniref:heparanase n=1 Tax=Amia ocellicauda TaxID=2972642 RepID=UPI0034639EF6
MRTGAAFALLLLGLCCRADAGSERPQPAGAAFIAADLLQAVGTVNQGFLSVAIDASLVAEEKYVYLLGSQKLRTLSKALSPGFLRFGGTKADFMIFAPRNDSVTQRDFLRDSAFQPGNVCKRHDLPLILEETLHSEWARQETRFLKEEVECVYSKIKFSESSVDMLYNFASCSGFHLIFGLNALLRTEGNSWDSKNAEKLLSYCESQQYNMSWELGNEPNSFEKKAGIRVDGYQLGKDFIHLREILRKSKLFKYCGLYGPDVGQPREHTQKLLEGFLKTGRNVIDACTWHHYYVNGRDASLSDFLDPEVLDTLSSKTTEVLQIVSESSPGKKVWLGETSSAYGGGAPGLSDTYAAGFMWLDKLGLAAKLGIDVVIRQVLVGSGSYQLVDSNFDPLPDYWLSLLYKKLVGPEVLNVKVYTSLGVANRLLRVYLHCSNRNGQAFRSGAVTLFALNLNKQTATIHLPHQLSNKTVDLFLLQPGKGGLHSKSVQLNGEVLEMVDDRTLPVLQGSPMPAGTPLKLPALSFAFYVIKDARVPACR